MFLLGVRYSGAKNQVYMQFLRDNKLVIMTDPWNFKPYFYTDAQVFDKSDERIKAVQLIKGRNLLFDSPGNLKDMFKVVVGAPQDAGGRDGVSNSTAAEGLNFEDDVKYEEVFITDTKMQPGFDYDPETLMINIVDMSENQLVNMLGQPIPFGPVAALDIEVEAEKDKIANPDDASAPVNFICLYCSGGRKVVLTTRTERLTRGMMAKVLLEAGLVAEDAEAYVENLDIIHCDNELDLLVLLSELLEPYPIIATFNGAKFDLLYLHNRMIKLGVLQENCCFERKLIGMKPGGDLNVGATTKRQVHLDLHLFTKNLTVKNYIYSHKYFYDDLNSVGLAIAGVGKLNLDAKWGECMPVEMEAAYCLRDAEIVYKMLTVRENEMWRVMVAISRICKVPPEYLCVWGTSKWVQFMLLWHHKRRGLIMPSRGQFHYLLKDYKAQTQAAIKGKAFKGASVLQPKPGLHFNVKVLDFTSLYTTIISRYNLSYETVKVPGLIDCIHSRCKLNVVHGTPYYVCGEIRGLIADVIGGLRDVRVNEIKPLAKGSTFWDCVSQATKTILNCVYGIFASRKSVIFFLPMAESVTAYERYIIDALVEEAKRVGLTPFAGDTDSIFVENDPRVLDLIRWAAEKQDADLEEDKTYVWLGLTTRKKNYLGVTAEGDLIIKGLQGRKVHTPPLVSKPFKGVTEVLKPMRRKEDFKAMDVEGKIKVVVVEGLNRILTKNIPLEDWCFRMVVKNETYKTETVDSKSGKPRKVTPPQHIQALFEAGLKAEVGRVVSFIKTVNGPKLAERATVDEVDAEAYFEIYRSSMKQVLDCLDLQFHDVVGISEVEEIKL